MQHGGRVRYCCSGKDKADLEHYYVNQAGNGAAPAFMGSRNQRGHGFGSFFSSLWKGVSPYLSKIGGQVLKSGANVARDMLDGKSFSESARARASQGITEYLGDGQPPGQTGSGARKRKRTKSRGRHASKHMKMSHSINKRRKHQHDIFS